MQAVLIGLVVLWCSWLTYMFFAARKCANRAISWCRQQSSVPASCPQGSDDDLIWQHMAAAACQGSPLHRRQRVLLRLRTTALVEGSLGQLLLRRDEVQGEDAAATAAQQLISWALIGTIFGLSLTLLTLGLSLSRLAGVQQLQTGEIINSVGGPLSHLPLLFFPTALGLIYAFFLNRQQAHLDEGVSQMWQLMDDITLNCLLPSYLGHSSRDAEARAVKELNEASTRFAEAAERVQHAFGSIETSLEKIADLDQKKWVTQLNQAAQEFRLNVESSAATLVSAAEGTRSALAAIPENAARLGDASVAVGEAARLLTQATDDASMGLSVLGEAVAPLAGMGQSIGELNGSVSRLAQPMEQLRAILQNWESYQSAWISHTQGLLEGLSVAVEPLLTQAHTLNAQTEAHYAGVQANLQKLHDDLAATGNGLRSILDGQQACLSSLPGGISDALRLGHEAWIVEASSRFDQDEEIYNGLVGLAEKLNSLASTERSVSSELQAAVASLGTTFEGPLSQSLNETIGVMQVLREGITDLRGVILQQEQNSVSERWLHAQDNTNRLLEQLTKNVAALPQLEPQLLALNLAISKLRTAAELNDPNKTGRSWWPFRKRKTSRNSGEAA
jgi:chromosome segregation ATPase